jgi:hypothetical protein
MYRRSESAASCSRSLSDISYISDSLSTQRFPRGALISIDIDSIGKSDRWYRAGEGVVTVLMRVRDRSLAPARCALDLLFLATFYC